MKAMFLMARRSLLHHKASTGFLFFNLVVAVLLLEGVLVGGDSLRAAILVSKNSFVAPLVTVASALFSVVIAALCIPFLQNGLLISVEKRTRLFSQCSSMGCTGGWLRGCILMELGLVALVAVPVALLVCHIGMVLVFAYLNSQPAILQRIGTMEPVYHGITLAALVGYILLILLLSAWKALRKVSRTAPVVSMKQPHELAGSLRCKELNPKRNLMVQLAQRNVKLNRRRYRVLSVGITCSLILFYASNAFAGGVSQLYQRAIKPFDCRVVVWGLQGEYPEQLLKECAALQPGAVQAEEQNFWIDGTSVRVMILEDAVFEDWYGKPVPTQQEGIPLVQATALSDQTMESEFVLMGQTYYIADSNPNSTPLGVGRMERDGDESLVVLLTSRSALDNAVVKSNQDRMFAVYYQVQDARTLNQNLEALLSSSGNRYVIQDYSDTSAWYFQRQAITILLNTIAIGVPVFLFLVCILEVLMMVVSSSMMRRRELALLQSMGVQHKQTVAMLWHESLYYLKNGILVGIPAGILIAWFIVRALQVPLLAALPVFMLLLPLLGLAAAMAIAFGMIYTITADISLTGEMKQDS